MSIVDGLRRASEALRQHADDLQALSDEVYQAGGEMTGTQWERVATVDRRAYGDVLRLDNALFDWSNEQQRRRDKDSREEEG